MKTRSICLWLTALVVSASVQAADISKGRASSLACQACHGSAGISLSGDVPNLAGQKQSYLVAQLQAFRAGERKQDFMQAIASQLSDTDMADLAAFWNSLPAGGSSVPDAAVEIRKSRMTFPANFPADFVLYADEIDPENHARKRSYASRVAVEAARSGKPLPSGSAVVVETFAAGSETVSSYAAMEAREDWGRDIPEILRNGDWSYALFDAKRKLNADFNYARCLACHKPQAATSYVFSLAAIARK